MLRLVWYQLQLFPTGPEFADVHAMDDAERDRRSGSQWLRSILSYLEFRSGDMWRRMSDPAQRQHPERLWYLNGIRQISSLIACSPPSPKLQLLTRQTDYQRIPALAGRSRAWLVDELMKLDSRLSDRRLCLSLSRHKLARMLADAQDDCAAGLERTA